MEKEQKEKKKKKVKEKDKDKGMFTNRSVFELNQPHQPVKESLIRVSAGRRL